MRSLSKGGTLFIASFEGYRPTAYNDGADPPNATIGYGHLLHRGPGGCCGDCSAGLPAL